MASSRTFWLTIGDGRRFTSSAYCWVRRTIHRKLAEPTQPGGKTPDLFETALQAPSVA
jgi:hypothetical protein